jgi:hypothetical protein
MAEIGLVQFAQVALPIAQTVLPAYRTKFSKHQFTQPQLLILLCLMRYADWTFRETEVHLSEHSALRLALHLETAPDYTTLYRFMRRLDASLIEQLLDATVAQMPSAEMRLTVAVDATGFTPGAVSTFFVHRRRDQPPGFKWRHWVKWVIAIDVKRQIILAQIAKRGPTNDSATLRPLVLKASQQQPLGLVLADAEFDSERNHQHVRALGARSIIPAKRGSRRWKLRGVRAQMRRRFPVKAYRQRSLIESVFSAVKRKLSTKAPGRSIETQCLQSLLLGLTFNFYRLRLRPHAKFLSL